MPEAASGIVDAPQETISIHHCGVVTTDMERAIRFYGTAFGFTIVNRFQVSQNYVNLGQTNELKSEICFMALGDRQIELVHSILPETNPVPVDRPLFRVGISHLSFSVSNVDHYAGRVEAAGGTVLYETRVDTPMTSVILCDDPDGSRLELRQMHD